MQEIETRKDQLVEYEEGLSKGIGEEGTYI